MFKVTSLAVDLLFLSLRLVSSQDIFGYEVWPTNIPGGATLVGGGDGESFTFHEEFHSVETIDVWVSEIDIVAIRIRMFDSGTESIAGKPLAEAPASFTFQRGERITGDMILRGNGSGLNLGSIFFKTTQNREFSVGDSEDRDDYLFPSGDSFLMGFRGRQGDSIYNLGFIMMKPLNSLLLVVKQYDFTELQNDPPTKIRTGTYINDSTEANTHAVTENQVIAKTNEWTVETSFSFTMEMQVSAGIPEVFTVEASFEFTQGVAVTHTNSETSTQESSQVVTINAAPCKTTTYVNTWVESTAPVSFTGHTTYNFKDGTSVDFPCDGVWKGAITSNIITTSKETDIVNPSPACQAFLEQSRTPMAPVIAPMSVMPQTSTPTSAPLPPSLTDAPLISMPLTFIPTIAPSPPALTDAPLFTMPPTFILTIAPSPPSLTDAPLISMPPTFIQTIAPLPSLLAPTTFPLPVLPTPSPQGSLPEVSLPDIYISGSTVYITLCSGHHPNADSGGGGPSPPPLTPPPTMPNNDPTPTPTNVSSEPSLTPPPTIPEKDPTSSPADGPSPPPLTPPPTMPNNDPTPSPTNESSEISLTPLPTMPEKDPTSLPTDESSGALLTPSRTVPEKDPTPSPTNDTDAYERAKNDLGKKSNMASEDSNTTDKQSNKAGNKGLRVRMSEKDPTPSPTEDPDAHEQSKKDLGKKSNKAGKKSNMAGKKSSKAGKKAGKKGLRVRALRNK